MAAFVALGAASLAYHAAMAKLGHDKYLAGEQQRRKALAICLRLRHGAGQLKADIDVLTYKTRQPDSGDHQERVVVADSLSVRPQPAVQEAWENVELFPPELALALNNIQIGLSNYELFKTHYAGRTWTMKPGERGNLELLTAHHAFKRWGENTAECVEHLLKFIRTELRT